MTSPLAFLADETYTPLSELGARLYTSISAQVPASVDATTEAKLISDLDHATRTVACYILAVAVESSLFAARHHYATQVLAAQGASSHGRWMRLGNYFTYTTPGDYYTYVTGNGEAGRFFERLPDDVILNEVRDFPTSFDSLDPRELLRIIMWLTVRQIPVPEGATRGNAARVFTSAAHAYVASNPQEADRQVENLRHRLNVAALTGEDLLGTVEDLARSATAARATMRIDGESYGTLLTLSHLAAASIARAEEGPPSSAEWLLGTLVREDSFLLRNEDIATQALKGVAIAAVVAGWGDCVRHVAIKWRNRGDKALDDAFEADSGATFFDGLYRAAPAFMVANLLFRVLAGDGGDEWLASRGWSAEARHGFLSRLEDDSRARAERAETVMDEKLCRVLDALEHAYWNIDGLELAADRDECMAIARAQGRGTAEIHVSNLVAAHPFYPRSLRAVLLGAKLPPQYCEFAGGVILRWGIHDAWRSERLCGTDVNRESLPVRTRERDARTILESAGHAAIAKERSTAEVRPAKPISVTGREPDAVYDANTISRLDLVVALLAVLAKCRLLDEHMVGAQPALYNVPAPFVEATESAIAAAGRNAIGLKRHLRRIAEGQYPPGSVEDAASETEVVTVSFPDWLRLDVTDVTDGLGHVSITVEPAAGRLAFDGSHVVISDGGLRPSMTDAYATEMKGREPERASYFRVAMRLAYFDMSEEIRDEGYLHVRFVGAVALDRRSVRCSLGRLGTGTTPTGASVSEECEVAGAPIFITRELQSDLVDGPS